jgi:hypothetical protein
MYGDIIPPGTSNQRLAVIKQPVGVCALLTPVINIEIIFAVIYQSLGSKISYNQREIQIFLYFFSNNILLNALEHIRVKKFIIGLQ